MSLKGRNNLYISCVFNGFKYITHQKPFNGNSFFFQVFAPIFDISINIHEYANEQSFILTHDIYIFVIYGNTGAITSCHNDSIIASA